MTQSITEIENAISNNPLNIETETLPKIATIQDLEYYESRFNSINPELHAFLYIDNTTNKLLIKANIANIIKYTQNILISLNLPLELAPDLASKIIDGLNKKLETNDYTFINNPGFGTLLITVINKPYTPIDLSQNQQTASLSNTDLPNLDPDIVINRNESCNKKCSCSNCSCDVDENGKKCCQHECFFKSYGKIIVLLLWVSLTMYMLYYTK